MDADQFTFLHPPGRSPGGRRQVDEYGEKTTKKKEKEELPLYKKGL
jgi:hypothetical protein